MASFWLAGLTLLYPFAIALAHAHQVEPRWLALLLVALALARVPAALRSKVQWLSVLAPAVLALVTAVSNGELPLLLYPVLVNAVLGLLFGSSLLHPPTVIERLARLQDPQLSAAGVRYTRKVTWVWLTFFIANGMMAAATALWASREVWALYNGVIAYGLIGLLFGGEWLIRQRYKKRLANV